MQLSTSWRNRYHSKMAQLCSNLRCVFRMKSSAVKLTLSVLSRLKILDGFLKKFDNESPYSILFGFNRFNYSSGRIWFIIVKHRNPKYYDFVEHYLKIPCTSWLMVRSSWNRSNWLMSKLNFRFLFSLNVQIIGTLNIYFN